MFSEQGQLAHEEVVEFRGGDIGDRAACRSSCGVFTSGLFVDTDGGRVVGLRIILANVLSQLSNDLFEDRGAYLRVVVNDRGIVDTGYLPALGSACGQESLLRLTARVGRAQLLVHSCESDGIISIQKL